MGNLTPSKDWPKITLQIKLDYLEMCRHIISQNDINPLVNILNTMTNDGQRNIQVNPQVWERRKGHQDIRQVKNSILDSLELILKRQY